MADVFISYKSEEQEPARRIVAALEREGLSVWWAAHLAVGQTYPAEIEQQLRSAAVVVVLWSPAAVDSLWVRAEATLALDRMALMPAMIAPCRVPLPFNVLQSVDLTHWQGQTDHAGWQGFVHAIRVRVAGLGQESTVQETTEGSAPDLEGIYWTSIESSNDLADFARYLERYPDGRFSGLARRRLRRGSAFRPLNATTIALVGIGLTGSAAWFVAQRLQGESTVMPLVATPASSQGTQVSTPAKDTTPRNRSDATRLTVPDVRGLDADRAMQRLAEARLAEGRRFFLTLSGKTPGAIYNQRPDVGAQVLPGTTVDLWVARARAHEVQHAGLIALHNTEVFDLDGTARGKEGHDIRLEATNAANRRLQPLGSTRMAQAQVSTVRPSDCVSAAVSQDPLQLHVGMRLCVLTGESRLSLLRVADLGDEVTIDFETAQEQLAKSVTAASDEGLLNLTLRNRDSPNLATGSTHPLTGGDFYVTIDSQSGAASFWANNQGQRGLVDLGSIPGQSLRALALPTSGYYKFGVPVVNDHVYVARALQSGRHIVMRVRRLAQEAVVVEAVYR